MGSEMEIGYDCWKLGNKNWNSNLKDAIVERLTKRTGFIDFPRFSANMEAIHSMASILIENHSLKPLKTKMLVEDVDVKVEFYAKNNA
jgi:hypothetical protein